MLLDYITGLLRMQGVGYKFAEILQLSEFMQLPVISSEYMATRVIEVSLEKMIRVHEQPRFVTSDRRRHLLLVIEIEYDNKFVDFI